jgi:nitrogen regulatory protein PII
MKTSVTVAKLLDTDQVLPKAWFLLSLDRGLEQTCMKRIEAIIARSALDDFHRCARKLGIFGFDISLLKTRLRDNQRLSLSAESRAVTAARIKVDFAVLDEQTKPAVHAVLESVHPESIGIFKFDEDARPGLNYRSA